MRKARFAIQSSKGASHASPGATLETRLAAACATARSLLSAPITQLAQGTSGPTQTAANPSAHYALVSQARLHV